MNLSLSIFDLVFIEVPKNFKPRGFPLVLRITPEFILIGGITYIFANAIFVCFENVLIINDYLYFSYVPCNYTCRIYFQYRGCIFMYMHIFIWVKIEEYFWNYSEVAHSCCFAQCLYFTTRTLYWCCDGYGFSSVWQAPIFPMLIL